jgi:H+/gluconate symporter-like permease
MNPSTSPPRHHSYNNLEHSSHTRTTFTQTTNHFNVNTKVNKLALIMALATTVVALPNEDESNFNPTVYFIVTGLIGALIVAWNVWIIAYYITTNIDGARQRLAERERKERTEQRRQQRRR